ncbi:hypothetical protein [Hyphomicrobium sp. NDB2Meth4]|uniref:hypothetical protein n=1 Tax=Hyphomicrobium sp. NDB2Meth4 TaxID=1892846 RepID=UPI000A422FC8|nr:hypothetical protein [Hyphomicrobium sp. NDB2Meth4]
MILSALSAAGYSLLYWFIAFKVPLYQPTPALLEQGPEKVANWAPFWIAPSAAAALAVALDYVLSYFSRVGARSWSLPRELARLLIGGLCACIVHDVATIMAAAPPGAPIALFMFSGAPKLMLTALRQTAVGLISMAWVPFLAAILSWARTHLAEAAGVKIVRARARGGTVALWITSTLNGVFFLAALSLLSLGLATVAGAGMEWIVLMLGGGIASGLLWWHVSFRDARFSLTNLMVGVVLQTGIFALIVSVYAGALPSDEGTSQLLNTVTVSLTYRLLAGQILLAIVGVAILGGAALLRRIPSTP